MITKTKLSKITSASIAAIAAMAAIGVIGQRQLAVAQELDEVQLLDQIGNQLEEGFVPNCLVGSPLPGGLCPEDIRDFYDAALCAKAADDPRYERFC